MQSMEILKSAETANRPKAFIGGRNKKAAASQNHFIIAAAPF